MSTFVIYQFNQLNVHERFKWIVEEGICLQVNRYTKVYKVVLFSLYGYYMEVYINRKTSTIDKIVPFFSYKKLDAYLPEVDIQPVLELLCPYNGSGGQGVDSVPGL